MACLGLSRAEKGTIVHRLLGVSCNRSVDGQADTMGRNSPFAGNSMHLQYLGL